MPVAATADPVGAEVSFVLLRPDGSPAANSVVLVQAPDVDRTLWDVRAAADGLVRMPVTRLVDIAGGEVSGRVNYLIRAYDLPAVSVPGTVTGNVAVIGFVFDFATMTVATTPSMNGSTLVMHAAQVAIESSLGNPSCDLVHSNYATCEFKQHFDDDLSNVEIPFVTNYGGGLDWQSSLEVSTSKSISTEFFAKVADDAKWGKGEGKLTTGQTDSVTISNPKLPWLGNVRFGVSQGVTETWEWVRESTKICGFAGFFCTTSEIVRPWEWTGGLNLKPTESPSYPYDQAGAPSPDNTNCTREYPYDVNVATGHDDSISTVVQFDASGGFRDEVGVEVQWQASQEVGNTLSHLFHIAGSAKKRHFLFVVEGYVLHDPDSEPLCPENGVEVTFTDASDSNLTNPGPEDVGTVSPPEDCDQLPAQIRRICDTRRRTV